MASQSAILICRWGGEIVSNGGNVEYSGGKMQALALRPSMTFNDLMERIHSRIGSNPMNAQLNVKMRIETVQGVQVLPVEDDEHLEVLRSMVAMKSIPTDIYVELIPICTSQNVPSQYDLPHSIPYTPINPSQNVPSYNISYMHPTIPSYEYGMTSYSGMVHDDQHNFPSSSHIASPVNSPLHNYSPMQEHNETTPCQILVELENVVNHEISVEEMYEDTNDESESTEEDVEEANNEDEEPNVRNPIPWFTQMNENYEVDVYWADSGHQQSFVAGGEFEKGMVFDNKKVLIEMVKRYSIQRNQFYNTVTSNEKILHLRCKKKCGWSLRATKMNYMSHGFRIVSYKGPHRDNCVSDVSTSDHRHLDSDIICEYVKSFVAKDPCLKVEFIQDLITRQYQYDVTYRKAWYAKQKAIDQVYGCWECSYKKLPSFMQALQQSNQGTVVVWKHKTLVDGAYYSNKVVFERVFWAFKPCIDGFKHCMPVLSIDGTHLYGKYKGTLLVATGVDANYQIFPLAFALVEGESIESWCWFMSCIRMHVTQRLGLCVISDRHAGIIAAMNSDNVGFKEPMAYHRFCVRHMASNLKNHVKSSKMRDMFKNMAYERQERKFVAGLRVMADSCDKSRRYVGRVPFRMWSLFHDAGRRYGMCTTNFSETFNNVLKGARFLPIMSLVELTFHRVNKYFNMRRDWSQARAAQGCSYPPKVTSMLENNNSKARYHEADVYNRQLGLYQVKTHRGNRVGEKGGHKHTVNFNLRTCTCNKPRIFHLPCSHVLAVCIKFSLSEEPWVDPFLRMDEYVNTYNPYFFPIPCETTWGDYRGPTVIPDDSMIRGMGRPKSKRIRNEMDEATRPLSKCGHCHQEGHNRRTCPKRRGDNGYIMLCVLYIICVFF